MYSASSKMSKQYGLILPNKKHTIGQITTRPSIFEEDSDSDTPVAKPPIGQTKSKKQDKLSQSKALEDDPTVYQYDEIYDEMDQKRKESKLSRKDLDKKPKYITKLLQTAERRKRENERRIERQVQKEREAEGEEFKDKESFITSSYKKKLEEMKALDEAEKREEYLESIGDVRKQGNLDGFYRHLYDQKVNFEEPDIKKEEYKESKTSKKVTHHSDKEVSKSDRDETSDNTDKNIEKAAISRKKRTYRSRKDTEENVQEDSDDLSEVKSKKEHLPSNLDADSDFSIDSSSDEEDGDKDKKDTQNSNKEETDKDIRTENKEEKGNVLSDNAAINKANLEAGKDMDSDIKRANEEVTKGSDVIEEPKPKKPKIDIWKKRTVGEVFDAALKRYFERKSLRESLQG